MTGGGTGLLGLDEVEAERAALVGLADLPAMGPRTLLRCQEGGAVHHWEQVLAGQADRSSGLGPLARSLGEHDGTMGAGILQRAAAEIDPLARVAAHLRLGHHLLVRGRPGYPARLDLDPDPPALLAAAGDLGALGQPSVALVGTRNATRAGRQLAADLAEGLIRAGVAVVSGLALGIDGAAHQAVVDHDEAPGPHGRGRPVAVIASGLDIAYPRRHDVLHRAVAACGLLVSETPLGGRPLPWRFPARNRLIAGLSDAVVVVESRSAGGSMLTAGEALARGVPVLAVPGHPTAPGAAGTNDLIFDGAGPVRHVGDVLGAIGLLDRHRLSEPPDAAAAGRAAVAPELRALLGTLGPEPRSLEELVLASGRPLEEVAGGLAVLEAMGHVARSGTWFERVRTRSGPS